MAWTKRTCAGALEEPQLVAKMLKAARASVKGRVFKRRDILNSPKAFCWRAGWILAACPVVCRASVEDRLLFLKVAARPLVGAEGACPRLIEIIQYDGPLIQLIYILLVREHQGTNRSGGGTAGTEGLGKEDW